MADDDIWVRICRELDELRERTGISRVALPECRPVSFDAGRDWAYYMAAQGYDIECMAGIDERLILLKVWEYGQDEPLWKDVRSSARPSLTFTFDTTDAAHTQCEFIVDELVKRHDLSEPAAVALLQEQHCVLPWRALDEIDVWVDGSPEWWADQVMAAAQHEAATDPNIHEIDHRVLVQVVELARRVTPSDQQVAVDRLPRPI